MERELYEFEEEIAIRYRTGSTIAVSPKSEWVRGYLLTFGEGYPYGMWKEWREFAEHLGIRPGTPVGFMRTIWILKKLGLVEPVRKRVGKTFDRTYYRIVPGMENSPIWRRPEQHLYPSIDWRLKTPEERRQIKEKYKERKELKKLKKEKK